MQAVAIAEFGLTDRQARFAELAARGVPIVTAAEQAGYDSATAYRLTANPSVQAAIEFELRRLLVTEGAPLAYKVATDMLRDDKIGGPTRAMLVKTILDRAGFVPPSSTDPASDRSIADMTSGELVGFVAQRQAELERMAIELSGRAERASLINGDPKPIIDATEGPGFLD